VQLIEEVYNIRECIGIEHQKGKTTQSDNKDFTPIEKEIKKQ
jgi:hypothetical protein